MNWRSSWLIIAAATVASIFAAATYAWYQMRSGELYQKGKYVLLQQLEFDHRQSPSSDSPIAMRNVNGSGVDVLGLPTGDKTFPHVWVITSAVGQDGKIFMIPKNAQGNVSCVFVGTVTSAVRVAPEVFGWLKQICKKSFDRPA
ncbi:MAG: hypothetical protein AB3X41_12445 [Leptothrix ochracea]|uniref:hypothetical protein n=1 Tax=Leptothrix ochracea TaxID=735331 RepID=UPI0034E1F160